LSPAQAKLVRPCLKNKIKTKWAGVVAQVVEHLPSRCKTLSVILVLQKQAKKPLRWAVENFSLFPSHKEICFFHNFTMVEHKSMSWRCGSSDRVLA
jgi:hypothetical protein